MEIKKIHISNYILQAIFISPVIYIFINSFNQIKDISYFIIQNDLFNYIKNTTILVIPTMILTIIIGVFLAYFETFYEFKLRNFFNYVNILPFCIPSYILGYIYFDIFNSFFYYHFKISYDIANIYGAIILLSISFYPYVYIFTKSYLKKIPSNIIDSSKLLGKSNFITFFKIILPLIKPILLFSSMLVMIETINSYGLPSFYGLQVFSTGIYKLWINTFDKNASFLLSSILLIFIFIAIFIIFKIIGSSKKYNLEINSKYIKRKKLKMKNEIILSILFILIFLISFIIPIIYILRWAYYTYLDIDYISIIVLTKNTFLLAFISSTFIIIFTLFIIQINRLNNKYFKNYSKIFILSYAIPGSIISISLMSIFISIDKIFLKDSLLISKSPIILILAYLFRFITISYNNISSNVNKIGNSYYESSLLLNKSKFKTFINIDLIMLKNSILSSFLLLFIEILKELPLTSINGRIETLAIRIDKYSADETLSYVAIPSLILITLCFITIILKIYLEKEDKNEIL